MFYAKIIFGLLVLNTERCDAHILSRNLQEDSGCEDFEGSYEGKDCAWVAQHPNSRCDLCSENGNVCVVDYCKQTCNSCDAVKLTASDGADFDVFGRSVAISDETIVVGASSSDNPTDSGSAYVFILNEGGNWYEKEKLTASDGTEFAYFGRSVAISDDTIVVGAYVGEYGFGSAYVFTKNIKGNWYEQQKLIASDGEWHDYFGISVAVSSGTIVVGAYHTDNQGGDGYCMKDHDDDYGYDYCYYCNYCDWYRTKLGTVYVFVQDQLGNWYEKQMLTAASDGESHDYFGFSVAISDDTIVVGAYGVDDEDACTNFSGCPTFEGREIGSVYVFRLDEKRMWCEQQKLTASDGATYDSFGYSVAVSDETIVVGIRSDDDDGTSSGSVYVFTLNEEGNWYEQQKLTASDGAESDFFGISVAISDGTIVVGANYDDDGGTNSGSAYIFSLNEESNWYEQKKLTASDGAEGDDFGGIVAISHDTIVVGAREDDDKGTNSGSAYIYSF